MRQNIFSLSIVLPAYNEEGVIRETVTKIYEYINARYDLFEIIVVNDGSRDQTANVVKNLKTSFPNLQMINHQINKGYGEALRSGFTAARMDWILLMDADGQLDINDLESFLPYTRNHEMILGYRQNRADPWLRNIFTKRYNTLIRYLFNLPFRDVGCAFKLFRRIEGWYALQPIYAQDHKIFSVEWLLNAHQQKLRIKQLPVSHLSRQRGQPTGARIDVIIDMLRELIRLRLRTFWKNLVKK